MKKILCSAVLLLAIVCALVSCGNDPAPTHTHSYDQWTTTKSATCKEAGTEVRYCSCGDTQTREIPKTTNHNWVEASATAPKTCSVCGATDGSIITPPEDNNEEKYNEALELIANKNYTEAYTLLREIKDYDKAAEKLQNFFYAPNRLVETKEDSDGRDSSTYYFNYNELGCLISIKDRSDEIDYERVYDANGNILIGYDREFYDIAQYFYDADGRMSKKENDDGKSVLYFYDEKGNIVKSEHYEDGENYKTLIYDYEYTGNVITKLTVYKEGKKEKPRYVKEYDLNGRLISYTEDTDDEAAYYEYDADGRLIKITVDEDVDYSIDYTVEYTYGANGELQVTTLTDTYYDTTRRYAYTGHTLYYSEAPASAISQLDKVYLYDYEEIMEVFK